MSLDSLVRPEGIDDFREHAHRLGSGPCIHSETVHTAARFETVPEDTRRWIGTPIWDAAGLPNSRLS